MEKNTEDNTIKRFNELEQKLESNNLDRFGRFSNQKKKFLEIYVQINKKNATRAAVSAGYSRTSAKVSASRILKEEIAQEYIEYIECRLELSKINKILRADKELEDIAFYPVVKMGKDTPVKASDKLRALDTFYKRHAIYQEIATNQNKTEINNTENTQINIEFKTPEIKDLLVLEAENLKKIKRELKS